MIVQILAILLLSHIKHDINCIEVETIEYNIVTDRNPPIVYMIFRDVDDSIIDWRNYNPTRWVKKIDSGYILFLDDESFLINGKYCTIPFIVKSSRMTITITPFDLEMAEKNILPEHKRKKLHQ